MNAPSWKTLGAVSPRVLTDARLQLHYAAQIAAAAGASFLEPRPDDSHPNLGWVEGMGALAGHPVPGNRPLRAALQLAELRLALVDADLEVLADLALEGRTLEATMTWLGSAVEELGVVQLAADGVRRPDYALPDHPVSAGARFTRTPESAYAELGRWFSTAAGVLSALVARSESASPVRCWPHHFDIATLLVVERGAGGEATKTVGVGLSPGDAGYAEPYWYVSPWPYPDAASLAPLQAGGHWHSEGYTAAILTGSELTAGGSAEQSERLTTFLDSAIEASRDTLAR